MGENNELKKKWENQFEDLGRLVSRRKYLVLIIMLIIALLPISQLPRLKVDQSPEGFLNKEDPVRVAYEQFRDQFGRGDMIIIGIGPVDVFSDSVMEKIKSIHQKIERNAPYLDKVTSLYNARNIRGEGDSLVVEDLFQDWPEKQKNMKEQKYLALSNSQYKNLLISEDARYTTILVKPSAYRKVSEKDLMSEFENENNEIRESSSPKKRPYLTSKEMMELVQFVDTTIKKYKKPELDIYIAGTPVSEFVLDKWMEKDMQTSLLLCISAIAVLLILLFRNALGLFLPLLTVILALLSTFGLIASADIPLRMPIMILPVFTLVVGIAYSIHIMTIYFKYVRQGETKEDALACTLQNRISLILLSFSRFAINKPYTVLSGAAILVGISIYGLFLINWSYDVLRWIPEESELRIATERIDKSLRGSMNLELIIDSGKQNGFMDPKNMKSLDQLSEEILKMRDGELFVGQASSLADVVKEINKALNENNPEFYRIPDDDLLLAQELMLFENSGSDDLEFITDPNYSLVRLSLKLPYADAIKYIRFVRDIVAKAKSKFNADFQISHTGAITIFFETINAAMTSLAESYVVALIVISLLMVMFVGDIKLGLLAMIPNLCPIIISMGLIIPLFRKRQKRKGVPLIPLLFQL